MTSRSIAQIQQSFAQKGQPTMTLAVPPCICWNCGAEILVRQELHLSAGRMVPTVFMNFICPGGCQLKEAK